MQMYWKKIYIWRYSTNTASSFCISYRCCSHLLPVQSKEWWQKTNQFPLLPCSAQKFIEAWFKVEADHNPLLSASSYHPPLPKQTMVFTGPTCRLLCSILHPTRVHQIWLKFHKDGLKTWLCCPEHRLAGGINPGHLCISAGREGFWAGAVDEDLETTEALGQSPLWLQVSMWNSCIHFLWFFFL